MQLCLTFSILHQALQTNRFCSEVKAFQKYDVMMLRISKKSWKSCEDVGVHRDPGPMPFCVGKQAQVAGSHFAACIHLPCLGRPCGVLCEPAVPCVFRVLGLENPLFPLHETCMRS